ncbi:GAF domain-containing protein [Jatrophihabitans sp. DSM 45814]
MTAANREADVVAAFIAFADRLVDDFDLLDLTIELTEDCARLLDVAAAGLLLADASGRLHLLAATSEQARRVEVFQLQREEGPCLDCYRSGQPVAVRDLQNEAERWPRFVAAATAAGFRSVHAIPMRLQGDVLGALGLFGAAEGTLNDHDFALAQAFAHVASIAIAQQHRNSRKATLLSDLQSAVASRGVLEMAKGIVSAAHAVDMQESFTRLRSYAHASGQPLSGLARRLVDADSETRVALLAELQTAAQPPS